MVWDRFHIRSLTLNLHMQTKNLRASTESRRSSIFCCSTWLRVCRPCRDEPRCPGRHANYWTTDYVLHRYYGDFYDQSKSCNFSNSLGGVATLSLPLFASWVPASLPNVADGLYLPLCPPFLTFCFFLPSGSLSCMFFVDNFFFSFFFVSLWCLPLYPTFRLIVFTLPSFPSRIPLFIICYPQRHFFLTIPSLWSSSLM